MKRFLLAAISLAGLIGQSHAATLNFSEVKHTDEFVAGLTYDASLGVFYQIGDFEQQTTTAFISQQSFDANVGGVPLPSRNSGFSDSAGTYFAASSGFLYGHAAPGHNYDSSTVGKWDLSTGALVATASPAGYKGSNFTNSYRWGGYTSMNVEQDSTGMYLISGNNDSAGSDFNVSLGMLATDLSVTGTHTVDLTANGYGFGFGFLVHGVYFGSNRYFDRNLSYTIDAATGTLQANAVMLNGLGSSRLYIDNAAYISSTDTLYLHNEITGYFYKATGVSAALGLGPVPAVPLPGSLPMLGAAILAMGGMGFASRRRGSARLQ